MIIEPVNLVPKVGNDNEAALYVCTFVTKAHNIQLTTCSYDSKGNTWYNKIEKSLYLLLQSYED